MWVSAGLTFQGLGLLPRDHPGHGPRRKPAPGRGQNVSLGAPATAWAGRARQPATVGQSTWSREKRFQSDCPSTGFQIACHVLFSGVWHSPVSLRGGDTDDCAAGGAEP
jgi:hypothetical protein